jgi:hypothetical protein
MSAYVENTTDPIHPASKLVYTNGEFLQRRCGVVAVPAPNGAPPPLLAVF